MQLLHRWELLHLEWATWGGGIPAELCDSSYSFPCKLSPRFPSLHADNLVLSWSGSARRGLNERRKVISGQQLLRKGI